MHYPIHICFLLQRFTLHLAKCKLTSLYGHLEAGGLNLCLAPYGNVSMCDKSNRTAAGKETPVTLV